MQNLQKILINHLHCSFLSNPKYYTKNLPLHDDMIVVGGHIEYNSGMTIKLFPEAIQRRRETYKECEWLSDWQVHSAHLVAGSIGSLACGFETGPIYVPMPTGSGKTVGQSGALLIS